MSGSGETRDGVALTNLDQPLFPGAGATKRDLVDYLDAVADRILPELAGRPLSVIRVLRGQAPFMQKNLPKYAPSWVKSVPMWAYASQREVHYPLCGDRRTLLWFANQRAVEYHPMLSRVDQPGSPMYMVLDLDPPEIPGGGPASGGTPDEGTADEGTADEATAGAAGFRLAARAAHLIHEALSGAGLAGAVKTSGAKGVHVFVPVEGSTDVADVAAATRAIAARAERLDPALATTAFIREDRGGKVFLDSTRAGGATVVAAYSPRARPGLPVSFPVGWDELDSVTPAQFTVRTAIQLLGTADPWATQMPAPQRLDPRLVEEGHTIPVARVQAMHEGKRRARARRDQEGSE